MEKIKQTIESIKPVNSAAGKNASDRLDNLTKPPGSLGRLEGLAQQVCSIRGGNISGFSSKAVVVMAADHGVAASGVSAFPPEVTPQMVLNFLNGGAAINVLARHGSADVYVVDMGVASNLPDHEKLISRKVALGTKNICEGPAMTRDEAIQAVTSGIEIAEDLIRKGVDLIATGDMGIGNTTPSSAITSLVTGADVKLVTGRGTGIDDQGLEMKINAIQKAIAVNSPDKNDGLDVLTKVGGFEIAGLAGLILGASAHRVPIVIDGFISTAGALVANLLAPTSRDYMIAAHCSVEQGHGTALKHLDLDPLLDLNLRLGEGTGAVLSFHLVEASVKILNEMATFGEAGVSDNNG
ncbi:MAG: nicotinate-nucleotide--dimethylbenzimidazole phosphoribosyltransferase [Candidatus Lindowbacteria bacterium]|nr:nicotinate-nucleotide--dimethylbenzimidazole phosphoribosyltransferase [Candidatus Lindowbacteria bacterium]